MNLIELLKARDAAYAHQADCAVTVEGLTANLEEARTKEADAAVAKAASDKAIYDLLVEKGDHYLVNPAGVMDVYKANNVPPGWITYQPASGK